MGGFFVQLAAATGAYVVAPALAEDHDYLSDLGVTELVDRNADVAAAVRTAHPDCIDELLDVVS